MEESGDNMSAEDIACHGSLLIVRSKSKKRSLVERELETNLTARITSPLSVVEATSTSRYGRARRLKTDSEFVTDSEKVTQGILRSPSFEKTPVKIQSPVYKMHASNSPAKPDSPKCTPKRISLESNLDDQIESIYHENISLSRFGSDEKKSLSPNKPPKVYVRKDLIQKRYQDDDTTLLIKNMFSPVKSSQKSKSHLSNILERSSEKYSLNLGHSKSQNGLSSVVKTLDFDNKKKKKENRDIKAVKLNSDLFDVEAKCEYQVGDLAWARMGTYPFWPCIVTREPQSELFVKKKLFGRIEHDIVHVTFFGDNGRRSWIVDNMLRKFLGQLEFEATREKFTSADKKKDPRFYAAFFISEKKQPQWNVAVEEAEMLLREPKRLRIDVLYDIIHKARAVKTTPKEHKSGKITRTASDVSLSESLYDTLFSEDDGKAEDVDRSRNKTRNKSLDVSEVVTACLDNMAAKTGITKIQRQSHMDRWLQKAKSKTPEKSQAKAQALLKKVEKEIKTSSSKKKKRTSPKAVMSHKPYSFRKYANESRKSLPHYFGYDTNFEPELSSTLNTEDNNGSLNDVESIEELQSGIGIISKVESLSDNINGRMKCEETSKIEDIVQDRIIDGNNSNQNKNVDFLSENIKTDKGNVIYDIQIEIDASCVQEEEQIKNYDAMFIDGKLARHLSDDIINGGIESQESTEKNHDSDVDELKINECITKQCAEMVNQTKSSEQEQIINNTPLTCLNMENCTTGIKVNDNIEMTFKKDTEANNIYLSDEESSIELKFDDTTDEDDHRTKLVDKPVQMTNNELHIETAIEERNIENSMIKVSANDNIEIPFNEDMEVSEISINVEQSIGKVKNDDTTKNYETKLIHEQNQIINCEPHVKPDIKKSTTEVTMNDNSDKVIDVITNVNESLNEKRTMVDVDINDSTKEILIINDEPQPDSNLEDSKAEVNVKDSTIMLIDNYIKPGDISLLEENNVIEAELKENTELSIIENVQSDKIITDDCDSIVHSMDAIIEDNPPNATLTEDYSDRLDSTKTHESEESMEDSKIRSNAIDEQKVRETSSKHISFITSITESAEKTKYETISDAYPCVPSNIREDNTVPSSEEIDSQNIPASCENTSFTSMITNVPEGESAILRNLDHNVYSKVGECITENNSHSFGGQNVQAESSENINVKSVNAITKGELKNTEQECFIRLNNICDQEDKCLTQYGDVSEATIVTETNPEMNSLCDSIKFNDLNRNELNKRSDLKLETMKTTEDIRKTSVHYVTFDKSMEPEDDNIIAHLPEIKLVVTEVSKSNNISAAIKLNSQILDATEDACQAYENGIEDSYTKDIETNEINNDKDLFQIDKIVSTKTDQVLSQISLEKVIDKHTNVDSFHSDSVPIKSNALNSSIHSSSNSVMVNGFHTPKDLEDFVGDTSSINSEDIEPLSVTRKKMLQGKSKPKLDDPEFVTYLEIRQDDMIVEHPELNENQIVEYLYETWMYEKNLKSETRKDDIQQLNLLMGLEPKQESSRKRSSREKKLVAKERKKRNVVDNCNFDTASIKSSDSGTSMKRWLRPKKAALYNEIFFDDSRGTTPDKIKDEIDIDSTSLCSIDSELSNQMPKIEIELIPFNSNSSTEILAKCKTDTVFCDERNVEPKANSTDQTRHSLPNELCRLKENHVTDKKIKSELDLETTSIDTASSEISALKPKQKLKCVDNNGFSLDDPEFLKYLELRQDTLTDENPQLTHEEIVRYLYQTWLYDESGKSDMIKSYEIEQSNLVKGLKPDQDVQRKKIRKKIKVEKDLKDFIVDDNVIIKDKPKRKIAQANCYKEDFSDIEDEIVMTEIMKGISVPRVQLTKLPEPGTSNDDNDNTVIEIVDEVDEIEKYFEELVKPKPNLFKGLIREKVCEICERTGNLVKCRSCNSMFHIACVKKETIAAEPAPLPSRGRKKKKKKAYRKSKEDSESQSDEKSQDVSAEFDVKLELQPRTVDAENFEALLEAKMKELLESNKTEIHYDSYSSDDGIDWSETVAGKCEIIDVTLKPKTLNNDYSDFKCNNCTKHDVPACFVCKLVISKTGVKHKQRCQVAHCHKYYHLECLDHWPQTQFTSGDRDKKTNAIFENLMCPRHVCHTCVSDDPRGCNTRFSGDKLARCVRCPATYHTFTKCIPAGTEILTGSHIVCPRHYDHRPGKVPCHVNTGWCFICALGGTLICCEYCPTSFHAECLNIKPPEGSYMCEDCETGRLPLYGEMVWVKLGHYRWWPGIILHPSEIPDNLLAVKHSPGEFVVRFFGQYDHYWVNRGRVFPFQEGDSGRISSHKSKINADFTTAMEHAARACEILKAAPPNEEESLDIASSLLPPHYVKLKVNKPCGSLCGRRVDIEESSLTQCECNPEEEDPCGPYSQCLNRMLLTECGPICRAGDRCNNRAFEKRLYPKMVPYRTHYRGWGLKTLEDIKAGQFVIEYVGELIDEEEFRRRMNRKHEIRDENFYFLTLDKERMIDAGPKGNLARFMNHCCEPNCETQKWTVLGDVRVGLFAIHDIPANSEVTFNYNLECAGIDKKRCLCGAKRCPGYIGAKPKQDESQPKKPKFGAKRTYKKRKNTEESPSTKNKPKRPVGRPAKPRELTEIEKDLLIIKNATNCLSSDSDCSRLSSVDGEKNQKALKRKRVSFSTEESVVFNSGKSSPSVKKRKLDKDKSESVL